MILKYAEILNFDSIIREWIETANELFGSRGYIGINDPGISPYREQGAMKTLVSLLDVMTTIKRCLPEDKRKDFEDWCLRETYIQYETQRCPLNELRDSIDSTQGAM